MDFANIIGLSDIATPKLIYISRVIPASKVEHFLQTCANEGYTLVSMVALRGIRTTILVTMFRLEYPVTQAPKPMASGWDSDIVGSA